LILFLSKLCWLVWLVLIGVLVFGLYAAIFYWPSTQRPARIWERAVLYMFVIAILNTI